MSFRPEDVGKIFDVGLATRDGEPLTVKNKDGADVEVSAVAYMQTSDRQAEQSEQTNLQRLQRLVQLSSPNLMDRQFDDWPQVTQGDWAGGMQQRVFSDATKYWDGVGLLWPVTDWQPQTPYAHIPRLVSRHGVQAPMLAGGSLFISTGTVQTGYAVVYDSTVSPYHILLTFFYDDLFLTFDLGAAGATNIRDVTMAFGSIWVIGSFGASEKFMEIKYSGGILVAGLTQTVGFPNAARIEGALVGNREYIATEGNSGRNIEVYDVTDHSAVLGPYVITAPLDGQERMRDFAFVGNALLMAWSDGMVNALVSMTNFSSPSFSNIGQIAAGALDICAVGDQVFILNHDNADMYLLSGGELTHIGQPIVGPLANPLSQIVSISKPIPFSTYALFAVVTQTGNQPPTSVVSQLQLYAYDVTRGSLFLAWTKDYEQGGGLTEKSVAAYITTVKSSGLPSQLSSEVGIAVLTAALTTNTLAQELYWGNTLPAATTPPQALHGGFRVVSSIIDLTSALPKFFRQVTVEVTGDDATEGSVTVGAWVDKNPEQLQIPPDYQIGAIGFTPPTQTYVLQVNSMGRKLEYYVQIADSGTREGVWESQPKLASVSVEVSVGWVWNLVMDIGPTVETNAFAQQDYCFQRQGLDHVAAYNFLRQLWRERGGRCTAYLPNGDSYNAKIQSLKLPSPKLFAGGSRSDQQASYQLLHAECEIREDA
jgi:hypothetical protein